MQYDRFNETYHTWSDDHFTVCSPLADGSLIAELGTGATVETEIGDVTWADEGFQLTGMGGDFPCKIIGSDATRELFHVVVFQIDEKDGTRRLWRHNLLPASRLWFKMKPYRYVFAAVCGVVV